MDFVTLYAGSFILFVSIWLGIAVARATQDDAFYNVPFWILFFGVPVVGSLFVAVAFYGLGLILKVIL